MQLMPRGADGSIQVLYSGLGALPILSKFQIEVFESTFRRYFNSESSDIGFIAGLYSMQLHLYIHVILLIPLQKLTRDLTLLRYSGILFSTGCQIKCPGYLILGGNLIHTLRHPVYTIIV